jgi:hypothetical protein
MDLSFLSSPDAWLTLITLSTLEIVLGIDNLVFISIAAGRLPEHRRSTARKIGIAVACTTRIMLLVTLAFLARMHQDLFSVLGMGISIRDLVLILGGIFLLVKGVLEIRDLITGGEDADPRTTRASSKFWMVIVQIAIIGHCRAHPDHGVRDPARGGGHAAGRRPAGQLHRQQPDGEDAGAGLHPADRRRAGARGRGHARAEALHLLRHGLRRGGGVAEPADAAPCRKGEGSGCGRVVAGALPGAQ